MRKQTFILSQQAGKQLFAHVQTVETEPNIIQRERFRFHYSNSATVHKYLRDRLLLTLRHELMKLPRKKHLSHEAILLFSLTQ